MWLKKHPRWGVGGSYEGQLGESDIEYIIDTLEKLHPMHLPVRYFKIQYDNGVICISQLIN